MGKRTNLPRRERDDYARPQKAVIPLLRLLSPATRFIEPCAGAGELIGHLERAGHICVASYDLPIDATTTSYSTGSAVFITNPPWRPQFEPHKIIANLSDQRPLWALLYSDWLFTLRATPFLPRLRMIAVVGRMKWIEGSAHSGYEIAVGVCSTDRDLRRRLRFASTQGARRTRRAYRAPRRRCLEERPRRTVLRL